MKKFLTLFVILFSSIISVSANNINNTDASNLYFRAYQYTQRYVTNAGYWSSWENWKSVSINITFDMNNDIIWIFSSRTQKYSVYKSDNYYDSDGEYVFAFLCCRPGR